MKREQSMQSKIDKCLNRLLRLIPKPDSKFTSDYMVQVDSEIVSITMDFRIRGAWTDERGGTIIVHITIEGWTPKDFDLEPELVHDLATAKIENEFDWIKDVRWKLSIDKESLRNLQRAEKKKRYWHHITKPLRRCELHKDESVEVLSDLLAELRPEFKDVLTSQGVIDSGDGLIRIETKGLPCPLCLGHLSEDAISSMYHRLRYESMFDHLDDDDDGEDYRRKR